MLHQIADTDALCVLAAMTELSETFHALLARLQGKVTQPGEPTGHGAPLQEVPLGANAASATAAGRPLSARAQVIQAVASSRPTAAAAAAASGGAAADKTAQMQAYIAANRNVGTSRAYANGWAGFAQYLQANRLEEASFTAADVADYLRMRVEDMGVKYSTLSGDRAAIADRVRMTPLAGITSSPLVVAIMGVLKTKAEPSQPKQHVSPELMREMIALHEAQMRAPTVQGQGPSWLRERDIFLLLVMMMGMLRESEAVALGTRHVVERVLTIDGQRRTVLSILVPRSKTDQEGKGAVVLLAEDASNPLCCPVRRYRRYRKRAAWRSSIRHGCLRWWVEQRWRRARRIMC